MTKTIKYVYKHEKDPSTNAILLYYKSKKIVTDSSKRYFNSMHKTAQLTPCERNLLDYCVEQMNKTNEVMNSSLFKVEFTAFMKSACRINYTDHTINKAFQGLKKANIFISFSNHKAVYVVNPLHFFKGSETEREKLIKKMLNKIPTGEYDQTNLAVALGVAK